MTPAETRHWLTPEEEIAHHQQFLDDVGPPVDFASEIMDAQLRGHIEALIRQTKPSPDKGEPNVRR